MKMDLNKWDKSNIRVIKKQMRSREFDETWPKETQINGNERKGWDHDEIKISHQYKLN